MIGDSLETIDKPPLGKIDELPPGMNDEPLLGINDEPPGMNDEPPLETIGPSETNGPPEVIDEPPPK
jgi:hypothetical protein